MDDQRRRIFRLIETADNFVKYARSGGEERAAVRARKRYEKAAALAERVGDATMLDQVRLRLEDLARRAARAPTAPAEETSDEDDVGSPIVTASLGPDRASRVPPGQRVTRGWPVLHEGPIPRFDRAAWDLRVHGACETEVVLGYDELKSLPNVEIRSDFHCVTGWSKLDNVWTGVRAATLLDLAGPLPAATHVSVRAEYGYDANLPLDVLYEKNALVAWGHNGEDLKPKHGFPLRLVVPKLYAWKSVKWVRAFELLTGDRRGFWEVRGYHNRADPWREERYSYQETS